MDIPRAIREFFQSDDFVMAEILTGDTDGTNLVFTSEYKFDQKAIWVYLDGQRMLPTIDYVLSESGVGYDIVTFTFAPQLGDNVMADYLKDTINN